MASQKVSENPPESLDGLIIEGEVLPSIQSVHKDQDRWQFLQMHKIFAHTQNHKAYEKKAGKYGTKEQSKSLIINSKEKEICELRDKEFKTTILKKLNDLKRKQLNQIRKMMHEQIENINKKIKTILKILEEKIQ